MKSINSILRILTFADLQDWVGETILNRGKGYVKRVDQLSRTKDNALVAWVTGSERYATSARVDEAGDFEYFCTCPYNWGPCKHTVAVILAAAEQVKKKESIPLLDENSDLCEALYWDSEENDECLDDKWEDHNSAHSSTPRHTKAQTKFGKILENKSREELLNLLIDLCGRFPDVRQHIVENEQLVSGQVDKLVHALRSEIRDLTAEPTWYNHWRGEGSLPDFSHVEEQLQALAGRGHADAVLQLGAELWTRGNAQVEQADDEGETAMAVGEKDRARQWCIQGYTLTLDDAPGIASSLQERLRTMAQKERRYDLVAAYRAQDFFDRPSNTNYNELRKTAEKAKCWPAVREAVLSYLETGQHPAPSSQKGKKNAWPLPSPEVEPPTTKKRIGRHRFPDLEMLIDVAIMENRFDDVVDLYQRLRKTKRWGWEIDKTVAQAVANTHPDLALAISKDIVNSLIDQVKPKAYEEAAVYLRFMKKVYTRNHRLEDWRELLEGLRRKHKAKRRLIGVLDTLSKKKLVD